MCVCVLMCVHSMACVYRFTEAMPAILLETLCGCCLVQRTFCESSPTHKLNQRQQSTCTAQAARETLQQTLVQYANSLATAAAPTKGYPHTASDLVLCPTPAPALQQEAHDPPDPFANTRPAPLGPLVHESPAPHRSGTIPMSFFLP